MLVNDKAALRRILAHAGIGLMACCAMTGAAHAADAAVASVPPAQCGAGSRPETALQGQVPAADRISGRSRLGYSCNLSLTGQYQGEGASLVSAVAGRCAYVPTAYGGIRKKQFQGVQVIDVSDPARPQRVASLDTRAFHVGTWESLKTSPAGNLLAGAGVGILYGTNKLDLYDVSDCTRPRLLNKDAGGTDSLPVDNLAHEAEWSPDGRTYWIASNAAGLLSAIDVSDPAKPRNIYYGGSSIFLNHGMSFNADGTRMYLASMFPAGLVVLDVSDIQLRRGGTPRVRQLARLKWDDGSISQQATSVSYRGRPYVIVADESGSNGTNGAVRIIDVSDERNPKVVSVIRLEIQQKQHLEARRQDLAGDGLFSYDAHYCSVDGRNDPTALACGYFNSGIRVFDIVDPLKPREIAYFNPPAQTGRNARLPASDHAGMPALGTLDGVPQATDSSGLKLADLSADWCPSPPRFVNGQLWVSCQDNGFMVLDFTNGVYPIRR
ncbi:MAG: hypothetical protein EPO12_17900 [Aquabacterium sp.]|nr:MAG: hypothetical protein EPO12_17900 [Aquabacterium sp.]